MWKECTTFDGNLNDWIPDPDVQTGFASEGGDQRFEYPRQPSADAFRALLSKTFDGLREGVRYRASVKALQRSDIGTGVQRLRFVVNGECFEGVDLAGGQWQTVSVSFVATVPSVSVSLEYEHVPGNAVGGDFRLDNLCLVLHGEQGDAVKTDFTHFEDASEPFNGWERGSNGQTLQVLAVEGNHVLGYDEPIKQVHLGVILFKRFDWEQGGRFSFSASVGKAGFNTNAVGTLALSVNGSGLESKKIVSQTTEVMKWEFEANQIDQLDLSVREVLDSQPSGFYLDNLLLQQEEDCTDFSGPNEETMFNGWVLQPEVSYGVSIIKEPGGEGNVLNFPTHPGHKSDGLILSKNFEGLMPGDKCEFVMRVRANNRYPSARLSVALGSQSVLTETAIVSQDWVDISSDTFTVSGQAEDTVLRIFNHNGESDGNDYRFSVLLLRRVEP